MTPPNPGCTFPSCPSGQWTVDVREDLQKIQDKQDKHYEVLARFGAILAQIESLQKEQGRIDKAQDGIYSRLREVENTKPIYAAIETKLGKQEFVWGVIIAGVGVGLLEFIFRVVMP